MTKKRERDDLDTTKGVRQYYANCPPCGLINYASLCPFRPCSSFIMHMLRFYDGRGERIPFSFHHPDFLFLNSCA